MTFDQGNTPDFAAIYGQSQGAQVGQADLMAELAQIGVTSLAGLTDAQLQDVAGRLQTHRVQVATQQAAAAQGQAQQQAPQGQAAPAAGVVAGNPSGVQAGATTLQAGQPGFVPGAAGSSAEGQFYGNQQPVPRGSQFNQYGAVTAPGRGVISDPSGSAANSYWADRLQTIMAGQSPRAALDAYGKTPGANMGQVFAGQGPEQNLNSQQYAGEVLQQYAGSPTQGNIDVNKSLDPAAWLAYLQKIGPQGYAGVNSGQRNDAEYANVLAAAHAGVASAGASPKSAAGGQAAPSEAPTTAVQPVTQPKLAKVVQPDYSRQAVISRAKASGKAYDTASINKTIANNTARLAKVVQPVLKK